MGLAASQARFLCLTARKANCEYKSTELAQEKLEITNQLSDIANNYAQSLNATKLMWSSDGVDGDYGVTYSLLMSPSPMNDFNPYMVTTPSGAVVLNERYAAAARAAGLSKAGGIGSQMSRDKFISALVTQGLVTDKTAKSITVYNYEAETDSTTNKITFKNENISADNINVQWNPAAGMGAEPLNKGAAQSMNLADMIMSEAIGLQLVDWAKLGIEKDNEITEVEYNKEIQRFESLKAVLNTGTINNDVISQLQRDLSNYRTANSNNSSTTEYTNEVTRYNTLINYATNLDNCDEQGYLLDSSGNRVKDSTGKEISIYEAVTLIKNQILTDYDNYKNNNLNTSKKVEDIINIDANDLDYDANGNKAYNIVLNGVINHYKDEIKNMTIGDLLSQQVVLMANSYIDKNEARDKSADLKTFSEAALKILDSIASIFGYSVTESLTGTGLNVDQASEDALKFAYEMVKNTYLRTNKAMDIGSRKSDRSMTENSAYINATTYNNIGIDDDGSYYAISISQMTAAFLTYFDNALAGANSSYVVGRSIDTSTYVTDNSNYQYFVQSDSNSVGSVDKKTADFFDQLYNNILEHGWREDAAIDDNEYLEASLKNGRYSMASLNQDGYYYQTRYNDTGYMVEVADTDAIARAEAEFTAKKAELTYKEDKIDIKTKNVDAEIAAITTEYESVKNLITKGIEKTFQMFAN